MRKLKSTLNLLREGFTDKEYGYMTNFPFSFPKIHKMWENKYRK